MALSLMVQLLRMQVNSTRFSRSQVSMPRWRRLKVRTMRGITCSDRLAKESSGNGVLGCVPGTANFLLMERELADLVGGLREWGVLVSDVSNQMPAAYVRVSAGRLRRRTRFSRCSGKSGRGA